MIKCSIATCVLGPHHDSPREMLCLLFKVANLYHEEMTIRGHQRAEHLVGQLELDVGVGVQLACRPLRSGSVHHDLHYILKQWEVWELEDGPHMDKLQKLEV